MEMGTHGWDIISHNSAQFYNSHGFASPEVVDEWF